MSLTENPFPHQKKKKSSQNKDISMISKVPLSTFNTAISSDAPENSSANTGTIVAETETEAKKTIHETYCSMLK